jgi:hypothetical protein
VAKAHPSALTQMEIAQFRRDVSLAAKLAKEAALRPRDSTSPFAEALRDEALATKDYSTALKSMGEAYRNWNKSPISNRSTAIVYAHTLILSGDEKQGRELAQSTLALIDAEGAGRPEGWFCRERAAAFAVLGQKEEALAELSLAAKLKRLQRWWYLTELDPLYEPLRTDPRFHAIKRQGHEHLQRQRALAEEMRRKDGAARGET